jgi:hypothetical protein
MALWLTPAGTLGVNPTVEIQWSNNGTTFFSSDPKDTFAAQVSGQPSVKYVTVKAPFYRVVTTGTTTGGTLLVQDHPLSYSVASASGWEGGASSLPAASVNWIGSTALAATVTQATPATYSAITAVPTVTAAGLLSAVPGSGVLASRISILLKVSAAVSTSGVFAIYWSLSGLPYNASTNPLPLTLASASAAGIDDQWAAAGATFTSFKEVPVLAPYFAIGVASGTFTSATFTCDVAATAI